MKGKGNMENGLTLGITRIGDLLLGDRITEVKPDVSLENIRLRIPEYQRPYKWTAKNANQLLDDIEDALNNNKEIYRVGTLILHHNEHDNYNIVDGQQRIITFSLLLQCFGLTSIEFLRQSLANNQFNMHNVMNNHRAFERKLASYEETRRMELEKYVCNRCELIVVITTDLSEAFQFFDSQNARGKALYPHDLLKAYHLREMNTLDVSDTERIVRMWENLNQPKLAGLFNDYLYRLKEWIKGNRATELTERNIEMFKGVTSKDTHPYAQYYKGAFAYAEEVNNSHVPFVTGLQKLSPFQINAPIIAGKAFFEYAKHYFEILADIRNNDRYEGCFINGDPIVKTLDLRKYRNGVGNGITRLMFDTAVLLYVDRFCHSIPSKIDIAYLNQFVVRAFVWAYSMRAQYTNVGWWVAQNYIMGDAKKDGIVNDFNIYKLISESDSPSVLLSELADLLLPLPRSIKADTRDIHVMNEDNVYLNYLHYFVEHSFWEENDE